MKYLGIAALCIALLGVAALSRRSWPKPRKTVVPAVSPPAAPVPSEAKRDEPVLNGEKLARELRDDPRRVRDVSQCFEREKDPERLFALARGLAPFRDEPEVRAALLRAIESGSDAQAECALFAFFGDAGADVRARLFDALDRADSVQEAALADFAEIASALSNAELAQARVRARVILRSSASAKTRVEAMEVLSTGAHPEPEDARTLCGVLESGDVPAVRLHAMRLLLQSDLDRDDVRAALGRISTRGGDEPIIRRMAELLAIVPAQRDATWTEDVERALQLIEPP